jgi:hypothetical protein
MFDEEDAELSTFYNQDIWPGVTKLVVSEMVKRSWSMFKVYLSHISMELGRPTAFTILEISLPTVVDDEVCLFQSIIPKVAYFCSIWALMRLQLRTTARCQIPLDLFWSWGIWLVLLMYILKSYLPTSRNG